MKLLLDHFSDQRRNFLQQGKITRIARDSFISDMGQQQSGFGGKRDDRGGGDADKVHVLLMIRFFKKFMLYLELKLPSACTSSNPQMG